MPKEAILLVSSGILLSALWPWLRSWRWVRRTSLQQAWLWLGLGGMAALTASLAVLGDWPLQPVRHAVLVLLAAFPLAVLGARRPGVTAWNFVVVGWLAAACLPHVQQSWQGPDWHLEPAWLLFLAGLLGMGVTNYLPTRFGLAAVLLGAVLGWNLWNLRLGAATDPAWDLALLQTGLGMAAWLAWFQPRPVSSDPVTELWLTIRDAYGLAWSVRIQEQVQAAGRHDGLPGQLTWFGLELPAFPENQSNDPATSSIREVQAHWLRLLQAVATKFVPTPPRC